MSIPNRQIGWSNESNLLWYISSELEQIICQAACCTTTSTSSTSSTTTTTTTLPPCAVYSVYSPAKGAYVRYIDCTTGEYVFAGPLDADVTTYYCAKRDSVSITFGVGTIEEVTSPCPTPSYTCTSYTVTAITNITFERLTCSDEPETVIKDAGWFDTFCARTGSIVITSGTATVVNNRDCTPCVTYSVTTGIDETGEIAFLNCSGGVEVVTINTTGSVCAKEGSIVILSGNLVAEAVGGC